MECRRGGSSTPSYKEATADKGKSPLGKVRSSSEEGEKIMKRSQMGPGPWKTAAQRIKRKKTKAKEQGTNIKRDRADPKRRLLRE